MRSGSSGSIASPKTSGSPSPSSAGAQLKAPSMERYMPAPSRPTHNSCGLRAFTCTLPVRGVWNPAGSPALIDTKVVPPLVLFSTPGTGVAAYTTCGLVGSTVTLSVCAVLTRCHVAPASRDRHTPALAPRLAAAYTTPGRCGSTVMPRPDRPRYVPGGAPVARSTRSKVSPKSWLFHTPSADSVMTYTDRSEPSTATPVVYINGEPNRRRSQVRPLSVERKNPMPVNPATYTYRGSTGSKAMPRGARAVIPRTPASCQLLPPSRVSSSPPSLVLSITCRLLPGSTVMAWPFWQAQACSSRHASRCQWRWYSAAGVLPPRFSPGSSSGPCARRAKAPSKLVPRNTVPVESTLSTSPWLSVSPVSCQDCPASKL